MFQRMLHRFLILGLFLVGFLRFCPDLRPFYCYARDLRATVCAWAYAHWRDHVGPSVQRRYSDRSPWTAGPLHALQHARVFAILREHLGAKVNLRRGRPGLRLWWLFVLGALQKALACDLDRMVEWANCHTALRRLFGACRLWGQADRSSRAPFDPGRADSARREALLHA